MKTKNRDLTSGSVFRCLIGFALPFLFANFMQAFYGAVDLWVVGRFSGTPSISAVNIGSQIMQIITSFVIGISMGSTVNMGHHIGSRNDAEAAYTVGNTILLFGGLALVLTPLMVWQSANLAALMQTPEEAMTETVGYVTVCSMGLPFIIIYNAVSGIMRGTGDSRTPMYFVAIACVVNIAGDLLFTGALGMGAAGAAAATVTAQLVSSLCALAYLKRKGFPFPFDRSFVKWKRASTKRILLVGLPIALQDTLINISFMAITVIANERGLTASSAVGVVEKIIMFMFLVPSAMLSSISAITAQNMGAGKKARAVLSVKYGILVTAVFGLFACGYSQALPETLTGIFTRDEAVMKAAGEYLRTYSIDCVLVAFTFCINGYLCGCDKSLVAFLHNTASIFLVRVPAALILSRAFPDTLLPMGLASPMGSLLSMVICILYLAKTEGNTGKRIASRGGKGCE